jgi:hypothetical protein
VDGSVCRFVGDGHDFVAHLYVRTSSHASFRLARRWTADTDASSRCSDVSGFRAFSHAGGNWKTLT